MQSLLSLPKSLSLLKRAMENWFLAKPLLPLHRFHWKIGIKKRSATHLLAQKAIGLEMTFTTDNIHNDFQKTLDAGAMPYQPITEKARGQKVRYLRKINGFMIEICTSMKTD